jgi:CubicO group peptidase (beta-lactamase class C family)
MTRTRFWAVTCIFVATSVCAGWSVAAPSTAQSVANEALDTLRADLTALRARHHIPLLAVSIARDGAPIENIVLGGRDTTPLRWGSITKTFTALTILKLHEAGLIDLNAPLSDYIKDTLWQNPWRATHPVRAIHLLELRAGFTDLSGQEFSFNEPVTLKQALQLNPNHRITRWPPGLQHGYSNMTPGLSQVLIEAVSHLPYAAAVEKHTFTTLQMHDSGFEPRLDLPGGFKADGKTPIDYWHMTFAAYGALNAPLADLNQLLATLLDKGALSPGLRAYMFSPHGRSVARDYEIDSAAGFYPRTRRGRVWQSHGGDADGYRSRIAVLRNHPRGYVANINTDNPRALREIERLLESSLTTNLPAAETTPRSPASDLELFSLTGNYYPASTRFGIERWQQGELASGHITVQDGDLMFTREDRQTRLIPLGDNQFRRPTDPVATVVFAKHNSHIFLQGELGNFVQTDHCPDFIDDIPVCTPN